MRDEGCNTGGGRRVPCEGSKNEPPLRAAIRRALLGLVVAVITVGCGEQPIEKRYYQEMLIREPVAARKAPTTPAAQTPAPGSMNAAQLPPGAMAPMALTWKAPAEWQEKEASAPRIATFLLGPNQEAEVSVTSFPGDVGGLLANVTRWAGQLGLSPSQDEVQSVVQEAEGFVTQAGISGKVLNFDGLVASDDAAASSMRAAVLLAQGSSIFVKLTGPQSVLHEQHPNLVTFCKSIEIDGQP